MKFEIEGIQYEMTTPTFGEDMDSLEGAFKVSVGDDGKTAKADIGGKDINVRTVLKCLKSWTFRGYDKEKQEFVKEGPVLEISEGNLCVLPANHGNYLLVTARSITMVPQSMVKNL